MGHADGSNKTDRIYQSNEPTKSSQRTTLTNLTIYQLIHQQTTKQNNDRGYRRIISSDGPIKPHAAVVYRFQDHPVYHPFSPVVPFWGQITYKLNGSSPQRDRNANSTERVKLGTTTATCTSKQTISMGSGYSRGRAHSPNRAIVYNPIK